MAQLGENIQALTNRFDQGFHPTAKHQLQTTSSSDPSPGRLNPGAASLLGSNPSQEHLKIPPDRGSNVSSFTRNPKLPRVDFPKFFGIHVQNWLQKTQHFFLLHPMDDKQKLLYASLNFSELADIWFQPDPVRFTNISWNEFSALLQHRFSDELSDNVIGEFKTFRQKGSVREYQHHFEQSRPLVLLQNPGLTEQYFVDSCIAGLSGDIRHSVQMFFPTTVQSVFALARLQEANLSSRGKYKSNRIFHNSTTQYSTAKHNAPLYASTNSFSNNHDTMFGRAEPMGVKPAPFQPQIRKLTPAEIQERRSKGLCYNCDEVWSIKHKCQAKKLFLIVGDCEEPTDLSDTASDPTPSDSSAPTTAAEVAISLNALSGNTSYQTLLLKGRVKNRILSMLVDTGSTHNFLDSNTAKALGCICSDIPAHSVQVLGGNHLTCDRICKQFSWEIKGVQFSLDVRLLSLGGCDLVLGVQWLKSIGPITMDFLRLEMSFQYKNKDVVLQVVQNK